MNDIPDRPAERLPVWVRGLMAALVAWGVFLAVGASSAFGRGGLVFDLRRSLIVLVCSALFLSGWYWVLTRRRFSASANAPASGSDWNQASLLSLLLAVAGYALWGTSWLMRSSPQTLSLMAPLGYLSALALGSATIAAMVGLSHPQRRRGQMLGLATLGLLLLAVVLFLVQVATYAERRLG